MKSEHLVSGEEICLGRTWWLLVHKIRSLGHVLFLHIGRRKLEWESLRHASCRFWKADFGVALRLQYSSHAEVWRGNRRMLC